MTPKFVPNLEFVGSFPCFVGERQSRINHPRKTIREARNCNKTMVLLHQLGCLVYIELHYPVVKEYRILYQQVRQYFSYTEIYSSPGSFLKMLSGFFVACYKKES